MASYESDYDRRGYVEPWFSFLTEAGSEWDQAVEARQEWGLGNWYWTLRDPENFRIDDMTDISIAKKPAPCPEINDIIDQIREGVKRETY